MRQTASGEASLNQPGSRIALPPIISPPVSAEEAWTMRDMGQRQPDFPYLPGESRSVSRSVGSVTHGWLINAREIPQPHPYLQSLPTQYTRGLNFTSDAMYELVRGAARHVADAFPDAVVHLGNFSAQGGGDIPYSFSHNSGRDADIGFFLVGPDGESATPSSLVPLDARGEWEGEGPDGEPVRYIFDLAKNWRLVEGLVTQEGSDGEAGADLQFIFISNPLKRMLLAEGRRQGAPAATLKKAQLLLHQPGGALPHNDHFHLRIYCTEIDVQSGCEDGGRKIPGWKPHTAKRRETITRALRLLKNAPKQNTTSAPRHERGDDASVDDEQQTEALNRQQAADLRLAAVRRLALLRATDQTQAIAGALKDEDPRVRAASARALGQFGRGSREIAARLADESDAQAIVEMVSALGAIADAPALNALIAQLSEARPVELPNPVPGTVVDARSFVAQALVYTESEKPVPALIATLDAEESEARQSALVALRILTNHRLVPPAAPELLTDPERLVSGASVSVSAESSTEAATEADASLRPEEIAQLWQAWWSKHQNQRRDDWLVSGFRAAGYSVDRLNIQNVWDLCRAVADDDHLSYNAQRTLMRLANNRPESLSWPKEDANFYWRRWFERRQKTLGAPPIPRELSTLR